LKSYVFKVVVEEDEFEDGRKAFHAYCPALEEAVTWGETQQQALSRINELIHALVQMSVEKGQPLPMGPLVIELESPAVVVNV
jgi:predicted RNase H-like HicB family nuclease